MGEEGYAYVIDSNGVLISHPNSELLGSNIADLGVEELSNHAEKMKNGGTDIIEYTHNGITKINLYAPLNGWSLSVNTSKADALGGIYRLRSITIVLLFIFIIFASIATFFTTNHIVKMVNKIKNVVIEVSNGNLSTVFRDKALNNLNHELEDIQQNRFEQVRCDEIGEMGIALNNMIINLREVVVNINDSADDLSAASQQLAASAEQSSATSQEVASSMNEISAGAQKQLGITTETNGFVS